MTILELLKSKGYAPGDYFNVCRTCGKEFVGDKRAITCAGCASEQVGAVAKPNAHSVLSEVRALKNTWDKFNNKFHVDECLQFSKTQIESLIEMDNIIKKISEHFGLTDPGG